MVESYIAKKTRMIKEQTKTSQNTYKHVKKYSEAKGMKEERRYCRRRLSCNKREKGGKEVRNEEGRH